MLRVCCPMPAITSAAGRDSVTLRDRYPRLPSRPSQIFQETPVASVHLEKFTVDFRIYTPEADAGNMN